MALRKKLYYPIVVSGDSGEVPAVPANVQILNDSNNPVMPIASAALRCFGDQSLPDFGVNQGAPGSTAPGSDGDRYGNVMDPNLFAGVDPANDLSGQQRTRQAIGVWFQVETRTGNPIPTAKVSLDFILSSAPIIAGAALVNPATRRRSRLRIRPTIPAATSNVAPNQFTGIIYIQRQHAIEV